MRSVFKLISSTMLSLTMLSFLVINCTLSVVALSPDITSYRDTDFSVSIPTSLPVYVDGGGNVSVSNNAVITNNRDSNVTVEGVAIETLGSWTKVGTPTTLIDRNEYSINVGVTSSVIASMNSTNINYNAQISPQRNSLNDVKIANVIFTIGYTEVLACNADLTLQNLIKVVSVKSGRPMPSVQIDKVAFESLQVDNYCAGLKLYVNNDYTTDMMNNTVYLSSGDTFLVFECDCGRRYSCNASKLGITNFIIVQQAVSLPIVENSTITNEELSAIPPTIDKTCRDQLIECIEYTTTGMLDGVKINNTKYDNLNTDCKLDKIHFCNTNNEDVLAEFNTTYYPSVDVSNDTYLVVSCTHGDEVIIRLNKLEIKILDATQRVPVEEEVQAEDGTQDNTPTVDDVEVDIGGNVDAPTVDTDLTEDIQQNNPERGQDEENTNVINGTNDNIHELC